MASDRTELAQEVFMELDRAYYKHGSAAWSRHEFYAILLEEVDEIWDDVKHDRPMEELVKEVRQVAAMCFRFLETSTNGL